MPPQCAVRVISTFKPEEVVTVLKRFLYKQDRQQDGCDILIIGEVVVISVKLFFMPVLGSDFPTNQTKRFTTQPLEELVLTFSQTEQVICSPFNRKQEEKLYF